MKEAFGPFLDGNANVGMHLWEHLRAKTFAALEAHAALKAAMATPYEICRRADYVRDTFLASIGGLPELGGPLNARVVGCIHRGDYSIEKVIYESLPGAYVTALLYVPERLERRAPGILLVSGHGREAKGFPEYPRVCHDLVTNGFVVLAADPTGQGERVTHLDPSTGKMIVEWGTTEHSYQGQQCILTGTSIARYFLFDALRGIDYLQSRAEVDPDRIGVTGNSGGGTQTSLVCMSGDPRVKAAVPCTYVTSREHYFMTGQPQDCEQLQFAMTQQGINFDDFFIPFAPRPLLIGAVISDFFSPEGTDLTYERLQRIYRMFGEEKDVARVFVPGRHSYCRDLRQAAVNWLRQHLLGLAPDFVSPADDEIEILPDAELWCTARGHVLTDFPQHNTPFRLNLDMIPKRAFAADSETLKARVGAALGIQDRLASKRPLYPRAARETDEDGVRFESVYFRSEPEVMICGCFLKRAKARAAKVALCLSDGGTRCMDEHAAKFRSRTDTDCDLFILDVRGRGAVAPHPVNPYPNTFPMTFFNTDGWLAWSAYCLGESVLGMRVFDVMRAIDYLLEDAGYAALRLEAEGLEGALVGYLAAALDGRVAETKIDGLIESFEALVRTELYRKDFTPNLLVHGVLKEFDLPDLRSLFANRALDVTHVAVGLAE